MQDRPLLPARPRRIPEAPPGRLRPARRRARAAAQLALLAGWMPLGCLVQAGLLRLPGRGKVVFARAFWRIACRILRLRVRVLGGPVARREDARRVVYVANHGSWLDIAVLGSVLPACFVAKAEVARWPGIGLVARLGRTAFISRRRAGARRERDALRERLAAGDDLILFPEGTSNDGLAVLPFRSAFFSVAEADAGGAPPLIRPVSVAYDQLGTLPVLRGNRALFAWYGDMALAPHLWALLGRSGLRASVRLHEPLDPAAYPSRKALAEACRAVIAGSAGEMRQMRDG